MTIERFPLAEPVEFRAEGTRLIASGVAMKYGAKSKPILGQFREQFKAGAFKRTLTRQDVEAHHEHHGPYLGSTGNGSLRLIDGRSELAYELDLPDTTDGRDAAYYLERRDIKGSSVGFRAIPTAVKWTRDDDGLALRTVGEAALFVVDLTKKPAYDDSTAELALRSFAAETGLELRSVMDAAEDGHLADLLEQRPPIDPSAADKIVEYAASLGVTDLASLVTPPPGDAAEDPPVARPRTSWLYA